MKDMPILERRRIEAAEQALPANSRRKFVPVEDDIEFGHKLTAMRLVGWDGISDPFSAENALTLVQSNQHVADAITAASNTQENFTKPLRKGS